MKKKKVKNDVFYISVYPEDIGDYTCWDDMSCKLDYTVKEAIKTVAAQGEDSEVLVCKVTVEPLKRVNTSTITTKVEDI